MSLRPLIVRGFLFMEIWKSIKDYPNYEVSNIGRVKSLWFGKERILKGGVSVGYKKVQLTRYSINKTFRVHQLVAMAFLGHNPNGHSIVIDHIDNDRLNNKLDNLQIISNRENIVKNNKKGRSSFVGVSYQSKRKAKWRARIQVNGKRKILGHFNSELEANEAYQKALKELVY